MNIIEQTEALKDLPDQRLMQEMQAPTGFAPQFLVLSELKRRKKMRDDYQRQQAADIKTVAEEAITAAGVPQGGITEISRAMNPNSSIAQNTGMDQAPQMQPTRMADGGVVKMQAGGIPMYTPDAAKALQARPGAMTGGLISNIARLKVNYPELYEQYKDSPQLAEIAAAAAEGMSAVTPELTGLEQMEAGRSLDTLRGLFTDPSNRAVSKKALEIEAMQPELNAAAEAQRAAALATGAYDEDYQPESVRSELESGVEVDPARIVEAQDTKSPIDRRFYANEIQFGKSLDPIDTEGYILGSGMAVNFPDKPVDLNRSGSEQSFVPQRPEDALLARPTPRGGDRPPPIDTSGFKSFDVRSGMGDVYADPAKIRAAEDATLEGIGSLGGVLTMDEAIAAAASQRRDAPISPQVEQPMLIDQMATANIEDESPMISELARQAEIKRMMEINQIPEPSPEADPISSALVELGEGAIEGLGSSFEAGVDALQSLTEGGDEGMPEITPEAALPEGFRLGDGTAAEGALSFGELLKSSADKDDTSTNPAGNKTTGGQKASATSSLGGIEGRIAQMLEEKEKNAQSDKWMALAQAGMALMASDAPTLGGAIGEAGLAGLGALKKGKAQYEKDVLDLLTLQQRIDAQKARAASGKSGGLTASNMITLVRNLQSYKGDIQNRIDDLNDLSKIGTMSDEERAAQLQRLQAEIMRTDFQIGTYMNALSGGGSTTTPIDVRGGSKSQSGVGYSLGTSIQ